MNAVDIHAENLIRIIHVKKLANPAWFSGQYLCGRFTSRRVFKPAKFFLSVAFLTACNQYSSTPSNARLTRIRSTGLDTWEASS